MIIITDSGSTKTTWLLCHAASQVQRITGSGINAALQTPQQIADTLAATFPHGVEVEAKAVWFYGAGCGEHYPEQSAALGRMLARQFHTQKVGVDSDLTGAARALLGHREGIACILGTGSNSCHYDGQRIVSNTAPLGWILGDEGSGNSIGRQLVAGLFRAHTPLGSSDLRELLLREEGLTYADIIRRTYREPMGNRFLASLTHFAARHIDRPEIAELVETAFGSFAERCLSAYPHALTVAATGGVAAHFEPQLRGVLTSYGYTVGRIEQRPDDGLIAYHYGFER